MHKLVPFFLTLSVISALAACSDHKGNATTHSDAAVDAGHWDAAAGSNVDAAIDGGAGSLKEGDVCTTASECSTGLACVAGSNGTVAVGICARPCAADTDCGTERCYSQTGKAEDAHCVNVIRVQFAVCGLADTSVCAKPLTCLYGPQDATGLCVSVCPLTPAGGSDDAGASDGGTLADAGPAVNACNTNQSCLTDIIDATDKGICGTRAARGALCGSKKGIFCDATDLCSPDDPTDANSTYHCHEDCSTTNKCSKGTCTSVGSVGYCL